MKVSVQIPAIKPIETFFEYLKTRATDKIHENNVDLIADFVDKVLVVEMKRLANDHETFLQDIEIPDSALLEPLQRAKAQFDSYFSKFLTDHGSSIEIPEVKTIDTDKILDEEKEETKATLSDEEKDAAEEDAAGRTAAAEETTTEETTTEEALPSEDIVPKSGNGHKIRKRRSLSPNEKDTIRCEFLNLNGQISEDACIPMLNKLDPKYMEPDYSLSIFQIVGFVSYLHERVARGLISVTNPDAYINFLKGHRALWSRYDSPKYAAYRAKNAMQVA